MAESNPVDLRLFKGPMEVTVDDEGKPRASYLQVSARRTGYPIHSVNRYFVHVGDQVKAAETVVAVMQPTAPSFSMCVLARNCRQC
jgi:HlyD family secretion protein